MKNPNRLLSSLVLAGGILTSCASLEQLRSIDEERIATILQEQGSVTEIIIPLPEPPIVPLEQLSAEEALRYLTSFAQTSRTEDVFLYSKKTGNLFDLGTSTRRKTALYHQSDLIQCIMQDGPESYWHIHNHPAFRKPEPAIPLTLFKEGVADHPGTIEYPLTHFGAVSHSFPSIYDVSSYCNIDRTIRSLRKEGRLPSLPDITFLVISPYARTQTLIDTSLQTKEEILQHYSRFLEQTRSPQESYPNAETQFGKLSQKLHEDTQGAATIRFFWNSQ